MKNLIVFCLFIVVGFVSASSGAQQGHQITQKDWKELESFFNQGCLENNSMRQAFGSKFNEVCSCAAALIVDDLKKQFKYKEEMEENKALVELISFRDGEACSEAYAKK